MSKTNVRETVLVTTAFKDIEVNQLLTLPDYHDIYFKSDIDREWLEAFILTAARSDAWAKKAYNSRITTRARLCSSKDQLEGFLRKEFNTKGMPARFSRTTSSKECFQLLENLELSVGGEPTRDMDEDVKAELRKVDILTEQANGNFSYDVYAPYDDRFPDSAIQEMCSSPDPYLAFYEKMDECFDDEAWKTMSSCIEAVRDALDQKYPEGLTERQSARAEDLVREMVCPALPYDDYLKQYVNVNIIVDTGDGDYDFALNTDAYNHAEDEAINPHASILWLTKTQGYSEPELRKALAEGDFASPKGFLETACVELANAPTHMNALTILAKMTVDDILALNQKIREQEVDEKRPYDVEKRKDTGSIHISKDAIVGMLDDWNGAGGPFEIELEKDFDLPVRYIHSADIDGANPAHRWSVSQIYGMLSSAWREDAASLNTDPETRNQKDAA